MAGPAQRERSPGCVVWTVIAFLVVGAVFATVLKFAGSRPPEVYQLPDQCEAVGGDFSAIVDLEQAHNAAIISSVAMKRGLPARAVTIALATAMQESGLRNIDYGDRDSVGLFQQRPSQGWGTVQQIMDPYYSAGKFYDALVKIKGWQKGDINDTAQEVQRSGVPDGYRQHEGEARALASALSGQTRAGLRCVNNDPQPDLAGLSKSIAKSYGVTVREKDGLLSVTVKKPATAWSIASFALAQTQAYGTSRVAVGGREYVMATGEFADWTGSASDDAVVIIGAG